jgi:hypothetical protein
MTIQRDPIVEQVTIGVQLDRLHLARLSALPKSL